MLNWFKNIFKKAVKEPDYRLERCFKLDDVELFTFSNTLRLPSIRRVTLGKYIIDSEMRVDGSDLDEWQRQLNEFTDLDQVKKHNYALESYRNLLCNSKNIFNLASLMVLLPGEDPEKIESKHIEKKKELFDNNIHVRAFFLRMGYNLLISFTKTSIGHLKVEDYLGSKEVKLTEDQFLRIVTRKYSSSTEKV